MNYRKLDRMLSYMKKDKSDMAVKSYKECKRLAILTVVIALLVTIPLYVYTMKAFENPKYPEGATLKKMGHISLYTDTFWYTDNSQKYEFDFDDYGIDDSYESGEIIDVYLDDNNNIVEVSHQDKHYDWIIKVLCLLLVPIIVLLLHTFVGKRIYAKNYRSYVKWYEAEIEPYRFRPDFREIIANKQYYDVTARAKD